MVNLYHKFIKKSIAFFRFMCEKSHLQKCLKWCIISLNIICTQPFGCLPNHICGKGMMKPIKEKNPDVNIVAIDYDAGATAVNQENRIKLMLANAKK